MEELRSEDIGVRCKARLMPALLYADDMVILAEDERMLKAGLSRLSDWCKRWAVKVNVPKCRIIHFRRKGTRRTEESFRVDGDEIGVIPA